MGPARKPVLLFLCIVFAGFLAVFGSGDQEDVSLEEASFCLTGPPTGVQPPIAPRRPKTLTTAAGPVVDDFHWLRDDSHSDPEVLGYLTAENTYSDASLAQLQPLAAELAAEMEGRLNKPNDPVPVRQGAWWYYERQEDGQRFWQRYRRPARPAQQQQQQQQPPTAGRSGKASNAAGDAVKQQQHAVDGSLAWDEVGPSPDAPEQVVLDPNVECEQALAVVTRSSAMDRTRRDSSGSSSSSSASGGGSSADAQHCDVYGSSVSPDGALVAFGVDVSGSEQYQLLVRHISSGRTLLPAPLPGTSGDYEWAADSAGLFCVTRDSTTNRPWQVWYISLGRNSSSVSAAASVLLWQEDNPAFYLSLSRSSSGRFLLLSGASEVTRQVLLMDLQQQTSPSADAWLTPAPRVHGVQQQVVGHWQSWLFLLVVSPATPNGELLVAPVDAPQHHTVLLPHRREVELEDVRIFAHHLVLAERQLGHTTITVYCLPANSSAAALAACRYNSTAASAAGALAEAHAASAAAEQKQQQPQQQQQQTPQKQAERGSGSSSGGVSKPSLHHDATSSRVSSTAEAGSSSVEADIVLLEGSAAEQQQLPDFSEALPLLASSTAATQPDAHHQSGTFAMIRGRAGSSDVDDDSPTYFLSDPAVAVEQQQQHQQQQHQQQQHRRQQQEAQSRDSSSSPSNRRHAAAVAPGMIATAAAAAQPQQQRQHANNGSTGGTNQATAAKPASNSVSAGGIIKARDVVSNTAHSGSGSSSNSKATGSSAEVQSAVQARPAARPPLLSPENSWQVAFEEDAYSVSILDSGDWAAPLLRLSYTSFTTPHTVLDIHMFTQRRVVRSVTAVGGGFRPSDYRSYRLWATAADGVDVPLSLVYRLDTFGRNGLNPALLMVYGAYGTKYDPEWDSRLLSLLDRGWVLGIAHVRGGGELGYAWHAAGRLEHKPNSFSDLEAAASTLIAHNLTSPGRLAVWGRSAGGLTAAGAANAAPHLFNAALLDVPFLDVLGDLVDAGLPLTVKEWDEWGHPLTNASQAAVIASYSPVHNVQPGVSYPHMLVTAGLMDKRVGYWEAAKWVAQLRAARSASSGSDNRNEQQLVPLQTEVAGTSDSIYADATAAAALAAGGVSSSSNRYRRHASHQVLLLVTDMSGGHFSTGGSGLDDAALKYAFLIATLPSCGSRAGLTGPDVQLVAQQQHQQQRQQLNAMVSLVGDSGTELKAVLSVLPGLLQRLLVGLAGVLVAAGLMTVLWQASRVWWPAGINPAVLQATLDLAESGGTAVHTPHSKHGTCGGSSSCKLSSGPGKQGREVSRRISTASTAAAAAAASPINDWQLQQRLSVSIGESTPLLLGGCLSPGPASAKHALSPMRQDACMRASPAAAGGLGAAVGSPASGQPQQQQQAALVFGGLMDDWLLELTSAVPGAVTRTQQQHHPGQLQQFPSTPASTGGNGPYQQQQLLPPLHAHHTSASSGSSTVLRPMPCSERRSSQTGNGMAAS